MRNRKVMAASNFFSNKIKKSQNIKYVLSFGFLFSLLVYILALWQEKTFASLHSSSKDDADSIDGILIGEFHSSVESSLLLTHLHPKISKFGFKYHLIEDRDDIDGNELIERSKFNTQTLIRTVDNIQQSLFEMKDSAFRAIPFYDKNIKSFSGLDIYNFASNLNADIGFNKNFDKIPGNVTYRIPYINARLEMEKIFNSAVSENFTFFGIDDAYARENIESFIYNYGVSYPPVINTPKDFLQETYTGNYFNYLNMMRDKLEFFRPRRDQAMAQHVKSHVEKGHKFTLLVGQKHLKPNRFPQYLSQTNNLLFLFPANQYMPDEENLRKHYKHFLKYNCTNSKDAESMANAIVDIIAKQRRFL
jgi:hypothetical protein